MFLRETSLNPTRKSPANFFLLVGFFIFKNMSQIKQQRNRSIAIGDRAGRGDDPWLDEEIEKIRLQRKKLRKQNRKPRKPRRVRQTRNRD